MISFDVKHEASSSSPLGLSTSKEDKGSGAKLSFSELLKGVSDKKDAKVVQNGALVLSLASDEKDVKSTKIPSKNDALLSLLKNESTKPEESTGPLELNPKLTANLAKQEIKTLVSDAKEYLKSQILQSDGYKKSQIKDLPKTLRGLADLAKKVGIDVSKITVEQVQTKDTSDITSVKIAQEVKTEVPRAEVAKIKTEIAHAKVAEAKAEVPRAEVAKIKTEIAHAKVVEAKAEVSHVKVAEVKAEVSPVKTMQEVKTEVPRAEVAKIKTEVSHVKVAEAKAELKTDKTSENLNEAVIAKADEKKLDTQIKSTPLFKAQLNTEHTTEQLVQTKQFKVEEKTPRARADETLKLLLMGEKPSQINPVLTADFSVATAKVIAPKDISDAAKALGELLHGGANENSSASKTDGLTTHKADSFEVKLNEAKQMIKYLSADVKTAIEDYKSPFTRVKIQLNPQKLGDVDLTIVQRGKNLHVSLSSNSTAINTLAMNVNELKTQLSNSGINNATLNFNNNSENAGSNQQQGQRQHEKQAHEEYSYFENETENEEILSSLEIVVPRYI
jgi:flagellar hook-length control protein FliK